MDRIVGDLVGRCKSVIEAVLQPGAHVDVASASLAILEKFRDVGCAVLQAKVDLEASRLPERPAAHCDGAAIRRVHTRRVRPHTMGIGLTTTVCPGQPAAPMARPDIQAYLNEYTFRFNRRRNRQAAFQTILGIATRVRGPEYAELYTDAGKPGGWEHPNSSGALGEPAL